MKQVILQMILFTCCIANLYSQQHTIWQLGRKDLSSEEFALAPDGKDKFIISGFGDNKFVFGNYIQSYSLKPLKGCKFSN